MGLVGSDSCWVGSGQLKVVTHVATII